MSFEYYFACHECKKIIHVAQDGLSGFTFYSGEPECMKALDAFLENCSFHKDKIAFVGEQGIEDETYQHIEWSAKRTPSASVPGVEALCKQIGQECVEIIGGTEYAFNTPLAAALIQRYVEGMERMLPELPPNLIYGRIELWEINLKAKVPYERCGEVFHRVNVANVDFTQADIRDAVLSALEKIK